MEMEIYSKAEVPAPNEEPCTYSVMDVDMPHDEPSSMLALLKMSSSLEISCKPYTNGNYIIDEIHSESEGICIQTRLHKQKLITVAISYCGNTVLHWISFEISLILSAGMLW